MAPSIHRDGRAGRRGCPVVNAGKRDWDEPTADYGAQLMEDLAVLGCSEATGAKHVNLLQHLIGFLKNSFSDEDKRRLIQFLSKADDVRLTFHDLQAIIFVNGMKNIEEWEGRHSWHHVLESAGRQHRGVRRSGLNRSGRGY